MGVKRKYRSLIYPLESNWGYFILLSGFLFIPPFLALMPIFNEGKLMEGILASNDVLAMSFIISYIAVFIKYLTRNCKIFSIIWAIFFLATSLFSLIETLTMRLFGLRFQCLMLQLLEGTNVSEAKECFNQYILNTDIFISLGVFISFIVLTKAYLAPVIQKRIVFQSIVVIFSAISIILSLFTNNYQAFGNDSYSFLLKAFRDKKEQSIEVARCIESNDGIIIDSISHRSPLIVLILGESFNKHHSSLYGYSLKTNPELEKEENMFVFKNVITPMNATDICLRFILSLASTGDNKKWCDAPLFPAVFKKAGYNVIFYSNQFPLRLRTYNDQLENTCSFLNDSTLTSKCFSVRNTTKYKYDKELIEEYLTHQSQIESKSDNLVIFHLMGQHVLPSERFPKEYTSFTKDSYSFRSDLSDNQKKEIADYDNATIYNDKVVKSIIDLFRNRNAIIIYLSDHGDEANDFRIHAGRAYDFHTSPNVIRNQLEVPFLIWMSDSYIESHPDIVGPISKLSETPFMTDDISHFLIDVAGISCSYLDLSKSPIQKNYNSKRRRMVGTTYNIDYDIVCPYQ